MDGMGFTVLQSVWSRAGMQASFLRGPVAEVNQEGNGPKRQAIFTQLLLEAYQSDPSSRWRVAHVAKSQLLMDILTGTRKERPD